MADPLGQRLSRGVYVAWSGMRNHPFMLLGMMVGVLFWSYLVFQSAHQDNEITHIQKNITEIKALCPPRHPVPANCRSLLDRLLRYASPAQLDQLRGPRGRRGAPGRIVTRTRTFTVQVPGHAGAPGTPGRPGATGAPGRSGSKGGQGPPGRSGGTVTNPSPAPPPSPVPPIPLPSPPVPIPQLPPLPCLPLVCGNR